MTARPIATIVTIAAAFAAAMVFAGCGLFRSDAKSETQQTSYRRSWSDEDVSKPDWISDATRGGTKLAAWGSTAHDPYVDSGTMRDRAADSARRELARMVAVKIQAVMQDYVGESDAGSTRFSQSVGRSIAIQSIRGSVQRAEWIHPKTREMFVWMVVDPAYSDSLAQNVAGAAREAAAADPKVGAHLRAKLESDKGFEELDRLLDKPVK